MNIVKNSRYIVIGISILILFGVLSYALTFEDDEQALDVETEVEEPVPEGRSLTVNLSDGISAAENP